MSKILVVYYSRTKKTEKAALELAEQMEAEVEKLVDCESRKGSWGYIKGGRQASNRRLTVIEQPIHDPSNFDLVVLASPTWSNNMAPALRTYIHYNTKLLKKVAFLVTQGSTCNGKIYEEMRDTVGKLPVAVLDIGGKEFKNGTWRYKIKELTVKFKLILR